MKAKTGATATQSQVEVYDRAKAEMRAAAALRQAVWEYDQFCSFDAIRAFVESVLREIESDRP